MRSLLIVALVCLVGGASAQIPNFAGPQLSSTTSNVNWSSLQDGTRCNDSREHVIEIPTENDFYRYSNQYHNGRLSLPNINWQLRKVVAIHLGNRADGATLQIRKVRREMNGITTIYAQPLAPNVIGKSRPSASSAWMLISIERGAYSLNLNISTETASPNIYMPGGGSVIKSGGATIIIPNGGGRNYYPPVYDPCYSGDDGYYDEPVIIEIDNQYDLERFWMQGHSSFNGMPQDINWTQQRIAMVTTGKVEGRGFAVKVQDVQLVNGAGVLLAYARRSSRESDRTTITRPYTLVKVDRSIPKLRLKWVNP